MTLLRSASPLRRACGQALLLMLWACGGRSEPSDAGPDATACDTGLDGSSQSEPYESSSPDAAGDASGDSSVAPEASDAPMDAAVDAGFDASAMDAGTDSSGVCPEPPLLTGNGTPLAPSYTEELALGNEHTCLLLAGEVWCWGQNFGGELGDGTQAARARPTRVLGVAQAVAIASGPAFDVGCSASRGSHTCALLDDATVTCWGSNVSGDTGWIVQSFVPIPIPGLSGVTALGIAGYQNCAVLRDGTASCWGVASSPVPAIADGGAGAIVSLAVGYSTVAALRDGSVWTWTVGTNDGVTTIGAPTQVPQLSGVQQVVAGWGHQCALRNDGTVWCWGINYHGELGDGTLTNANTPVQAVGVAKAVGLTAGSGDTCAIFSDGTTMCWGDNTYGQMGTGSAGGSQPLPALVPGLTHVGDIRAGLEHVCARRWDLTVWCWGGNETGQVGDGTTVTRPSPVQVFP